MPLATAKLSASSAGQVERYNQTLFASAEVLKESTPVNILLSRALSSF